MAEDRVERILDSAIECFTRHGLRKTTMDDIAASAGMSRPALYQYVRNKEDVYLRAAGRVYRQASQDAGEAAAAGGTLTQRLDRILGVRLALARRVGPDSPYRSDPTLAAARALAEVEGAFVAELTELLVMTIIDAAASARLPLGESNAREVAEICLALTRGLEIGPAAGTAGGIGGNVDAGSGVDEVRDRLHNGISLLVAGLAAAAPRIDPGRLPVEVG